MVSLPLAQFHVFPDPFRYLFWHCFCMDFTSFLGAFWHNFSCFWVIDFLMISLILFRRRCLWRFLASRWLPFGSIFGTPALQLGMPALHLATPALHLATPALHLATFGILVDLCWFMLITGARADYSLGRDQSNWLFPRQGLKGWNHVDLYWFILIYGAKTDYSLGGVQDRWNIDLCWFMLIYVDLCWFMVPKLIIP